MFRQFFISLEFEGEKGFSLQYFLFNIIVIMQNFHYNIEIEKTACGITRKPFLNSFFNCQLILLAFCYNLKRSVKNCGIIQNYASAVRTRLLMETY